ncbi:hypothetical protein [Rheinheimera sp.]|uniref:hypothetical protein n=1 Tax=Rheinheimera sp. TaxID=1869214 RepID=UPI0025F1E76B|nr:hypothetical protein [Rheinheimera sp.]
MRYPLLVFVVALVVLFFFKLDIYNEITEGEVNILGRPEKNLNLDFNTESNNNLPKLTDSDPKSGLLDNPVSLISNDSAVEVEPHLDFDSNFVAEKIVSSNSELYKKLLDDYKKEKFLAKEVSSSEFVIARIHAKGDIIFTLYNNKMVKYARENPEAYFQKAQQNIGNLYDKGEHASGDGSEFVDTLYQMSKPLNIDIISTYCNGSSCYFEAIFKSTADVDRLFAQLEGSSKVNVVLTAVFSISSKSFVATAFLI